MRFVISFSYRDARPQFVRARTQPSHFSIARASSILQQWQRKDFIKLYLILFHWSYLSLQIRKVALEYVNIRICRFLNPPPGSIHTVNSTAIRWIFKKSKHVLIIFWICLLLQRLLGQLLGRLRRDITESSLRYPHGFGDLSRTQNGPMRHYPVLLHNLGDFMWILFNPSDGLPSIRSVCAPLMIISPHRLIHWTNLSLGILNAIQWVAHTIRSILLNSVKA